MNNEKKVSLAVFLTFLVTSVLYLSAFILVPALSSLPEMLLSGISGTKNSRELSAKIGEIEHHIEKKYINEYDTATLNDMALKGYVAGLDDVYSTYYTKEEFEELNSQMEGEYKGIGIEVVIDNDNLITVVNVFENSPAHKANIIPGDKIVKVNETDVTGDNYDLALDMMRGVGEYGKSDTFFITVKRGEETIKSQITREKIDTQTVSSEMLEGNIGYISLSSFLEESDEEFIAHTDRLISQGAKSLIIDLRNNGGGILDTVLRISDYLMGEGTILTIKNKGVAPNVFKSDKKRIDLPMCVLINGNSASASEVLAGALKDNKEAALVGETSYGKGVVQTVVDLSDGSGLKITTAKYYTPSGKCIDQKGIKPDVEVKMELTKSLFLYEKHEDIQLQEAIKILNN